MMSSDMMNPQNENKSNSNKLNEEYKRQPYRKSTSIEMNGKIESMEKPKNNISQLL